MLGEDGPLLGLKFPMGVEAKEMVRAIRDGAESLGLEKELYTIHSLRAGGATALFGMGYDGLAVKTLGRWMSDAYLIYPSISPVATQSMAMAMAQFDGQVTRGPSPLVGDGSE